MSNTQFLQKVEKTMKEVDGIISAVTTTATCVVVTIQMVRDFLHKKS